MFNIPGVAKFSLKGQMVSFTCAGYGVSGASPQLYPFQTEPSLDNRTQTSMAVLTPLPSQKQTEGWILRPATDLPWT